MVGLKDMEKPSTWARDKQNRETDWGLYDETLWPSWDRAHGASPQQGRARVQPQYKVKQGRRGGVLRKQTLAHGEG